MSPIRCCVITIAFIAFLSALHAAPAHADIELRRTLASPGETSILVPAHNGLRRIVLEMALPPHARVTAMASWTPFDRTLDLRLASPSRATPLVMTSGPSPMVVGTALDTSGGRHWLSLDDASGGDSFLISIQVLWTLPRPLESARRAPDAPALERPAPAPDRPAPAPAMPAVTSTRPSSSPPAAAAPPVPTPAPRIAELGWREGGQVRLAHAHRDGLRIALSSPILSEVPRDAVRLEVMVPGSQDGLARWEEVLADVRVEGSSVIVRLPPKLTFTREVSARLLVEGAALRNAAGAYLDADGSGASLPSGDGRPGGTFRSQFRIVP